MQEMDTTSSASALKRKDLEEYKDGNGISKKPKHDEEVKEEEEEAPDWDDEIEEEYIDVVDKDLILYHEVPFPDYEELHEQSFRANEFVFAVPRDAWGSGELKHFASLEDFDSYVRTHVRTAKHLAEICSLLLEDKRDFGLIIEQTTIMPIPRIQTAGRILRLPVLPSVSKDDVMDDEFDFSTRLQGSTPSQSMMVEKDKDLVMWNRVHYSQDAPCQFSFKTQQVMFAVPKDAWGRGQLRGCRTPQQFKIYLSRHVHTAEPLARECRESFKGWELPWQGQLLQVNGPTQHIVNLPVYTSLS